MIAKIRFQKDDYPGYNQKRGDGAKCNRSFPLGDCCTYKFCMKSKEAEAENEAISVATYLAMIIMRVAPPEK